MKNGILGHVILETFRILQTNFVAIDCHGLRLEERERRIYLKLDFIAARIAFAEYFREKGAM